MVSGLSLADRGVHVNTSFGPPGEKRKRAAPPFVALLLLSGVADEHLADLEAGRRFISCFRFIRFGWLAAFEGMNRQALDLDCFIFTDLELDVVDLPGREARKGRLRLVDF